MLEILTSEIGSIRVSDRNDLLRHDHLSSDSIYRNSDVVASGVSLDPAGSLTYIL